MAQKSKEKILVINQLGYIIESIEESPVINMDWIESVEGLKNNKWSFKIRKGMKYYPGLIRLFVSKNKKLTIDGTFCEISENLTKLKENIRNISI